MSPEPQLASNARRLCGLRVTVKWAMLAGVLVLARAHLEVRPELHRGSRGFGVGDPGFEPGTSALSERRSNQLS
jgi:hypothetical protein